MHAPIVLPDADAGVGGTEVDTDSGAVNLSHCCLACVLGGKGDTNDGAFANVREK